MANIEALRWTLIVSVVIYYLFDFFDSKRVLDEREELIRLKTYEAVHKITTATLSVLAIAHFFFPNMSAIAPLLSLVLAFLYSEIFGKLWYRKRL